MEAGEAESTDCVDRHILFITPLSSSRRRSAFASHHQAQPLPQPRPTRTAGEVWLGRESSSVSTSNSSLRPSQACTAQEGCGIGGSSKLSRRLKKGAGGLWGAKRHQAPCRTAPATPHTLPDTRNCPPMRLAKPQVAAPPPSMRTRRGAPPSQLLHGAECGAAVSPAADPSNSHP